MRYVIEDNKSGTVWIRTVGCSQYTLTTVRKQARVWKTYEGVLSGYAQVRKHCALGAPSLVIVEIADEALNEVHDHNIGDDD